jgi:hypothetical protein
MPTHPISRLAAMVGNGQYLNQAIYLASNNVKVKNLEHCASNVGRKDDAGTGRVGAGARQGIQKVIVVASAQPGLSFLVVSHLLFVFFGGLGVEPIAHLKRAWT